MLGAKLITVLNTFDTKEKRQCRLWLQNPLHNTRADVLLLYDTLLKDKELAKAKLWKILYAKTAYQDGKLRQVMHKLQAGVEDFLIYQQLESKKGVRAIFLLQSLEQRKLKELLEIKTKSIRKIIAKDIPNNWEGLRIQYQLAVLSNETLNTKRSIAANIQEISDALDIQYFADKLRQACILYSRVVVYKMDFNPKMLEIVLEEVKDSDYLNIPAIAIYYYCYLAMTTKADGDKYFRQMMDLLERESQCFPTSELRELYLLAINYTIKRHNTGSEWHREQAFNLYKKGITKGYLLENESLSPFTYNNTVAFAILMKQYEWVEQFIHEYKDYIQPEERESVYQECLAKLYYAQKRYAAVQQLLLQIDTKDILRNISCKVILAKIYYETDELNALDSLLHSLRIYLKRKEVVGYHKQSFSNFVLYMQKLLRVNPFSKEEKQKLREKINAVPVLAAKAWLLEQLETL